MVGENISQEITLKNIEETRNYFTKEVDENYLMSNNDKKVCRALNWTLSCFSFCG